MLRLKDVSTASLKALGSNHLLCQLSYSSVSISHVNIVMLENELVQRNLSQATSLRRANN